MTFVSMNCVTPDPAQAEEFEQAFLRGSFGGHSELRTYEVIDVEQPA
jgi:hypothetical protein